MSSVDTVNVELSSGLDIEFKLIPACSFVMGSRGYSPIEEPMHRVVITRAFYMGVVPVTQAQFWDCTKERAPDLKNHFPDNPRNPAERMTWVEANKFCNWLTTEYRDQLPDGYRAGLPSEAQWEYACRGVKDEDQNHYSTEYHTGDGEGALDQAGWYDINSERKTHPVKLKQANEFGLYDMHGNVWEWCRDEWR